MTYILLYCREMEEISTFIKGAICDDQCLGRCLYIHGVPGTGKVKFLCCISMMFDYIVEFNASQILICPYLQTMSVLSVMRGLRSEVDAGITKPYSFVEINGLKLATPENIYRVLTCSNFRCF